MANEAQHDPQHRTPAAPPAPANQPNTCAACGGPIAALSFELAGALVCPFCAAWHALETLDPHGTDEVTVRQIQHAKLVLAIAGDQLQRARLAPLAGVRRPPAKERP